VAFALARLASFRASSTAFALAARCSFAAFSFATFSASSLARRLSAFISSASVL